MTDPTPRDFLHAFNAAQIEEENHARGCAGREYACTCGYDNAMEAEIRRLRREVVTVRREALTDARNAVIAEYLSEDSEDPTDVSYDHAITDCSNAIRTLIERTP